MTSSVLTCAICVSSLAKSLLKHFGHFFFFFKNGLFVFILSNHGFKMCLSERDMFVTFLPRVCLFISRFLPSQIPSTLRKQTPGRMTSSSSIPVSLTVPTFWVPSRKTLRRVPQISPTFSSKSFSSYAEACGPFESVFARGGPPVYAACRRLFVKDDVRATESPRRR